ncbi:MAG: F0F1 ATP synthase subunit B [Chloroflexi bacterium]|nr:F0F1 ATP synthase subunit B [Chloroflexota bacterium]
MEALGINLPGLVAQIVNVALLLVILRAFALPAVVRMLDERSARIRESLEAAEQMRRQATRAEQQVQEQIEQGRREGQAILQQAAQLGEQMKEQAREEARKEAEAIINRARAEITLEREMAMNELRRQFVDLAVLAAERVIQQELDRSKHQRLIVDVLETSGSGDGRRSPS